MSQVDPALTAKADQRVAECREQVQWLVDEARSLLARGATQNQVIASIGLGSLISVPPNYLAFELGVAVYMLAEEKVELPEVRDG